MCLEIDRSRHRFNWDRKAIPVVLEEDLTAYKVIRKNGRSAYRHYLYKPHTPYSKRKLRPTLEIVYGAAFHVYEKYPSPLGYFRSHHEMVIKVVIPKGSSIFYGRRGDIATNKLKTLSFPKCYDPSLVY